MPTLFDSHEEFNEWFSKDIENHAENKSAIDQGMTLNSIFLRLQTVSSGFKFLFFDGSLLQIFISCCYNNDMSQMSNHC